LESKYRVEFSKSKEEVLEILKVYLEVFLIFMVKVLKNNGKWI
jgi:hypothetical protein